MLEPQLMLTTEPPEEEYVYDEREIGEDYAADDTELVGTNGEHFESDDDSYVSVDDEHGDKSFSYDDQLTVMEVDDDFDWDMNRKTIR